MDGYVFGLRNETEINSSILKILFTIKPFYFSSNMPAILLEKYKGLVKKIILLNG